MDQEKITALKASRLIDGNGGDVLNNPVVLIEEKKIKKSAPQEK